MNSAQQPEAAAMKPAGGVHPPLPAGPYRLASRVSLPMAPDSGHVTRLRHDSGGLPFDWRSPGFSFVVRYEQPQHDQRGAISDRLPSHLKSSTED